VLPQLTVGFVPIPADNCLSIQAKSALLPKKTMQTLRCPNNDCQFLGKTAPETHRALKFGQDMRPQAMQAGISRKPLKLRQIFGSGMCFLNKYQVVF